MSGLRLCLCLLAALAVAGIPAAAEEVAVSDSGPKLAGATHECTRGHQVETREVRLENSRCRYGFRYSGCQDPSHGDLRPSAEGNFGMPVPTVCNWYWGGFIQVLVNGQNAVGYKVTDFRVTEKGARGGFQVRWSHPAAQVSLRLVLPAQDNHVQALLTWQPQAGQKVEAVQVRLTCYPSFFTTSRGRQGERHCQTPRTDSRQPQTLALVPAEDTWLYFHDTVFDVARGEGEGPCAALVAPEGVTGGKVQIGDYAVQTLLDLKPEAGMARLGFYDFVGRTNAQAAEYLQTHGQRDLAALRACDFRPLAVQKLAVGEMRAEADKLLAAAADDGVTLKPQVEELFRRVGELRAQAAGGDWGAEVDMAKTAADSADLFWRLRIYAALNQP